MSVGVMKDEKLKLRGVHPSHTLFFYFGNQAESPTPGTHTSTNREDVLDLKFLLTSRKLHQTSPT
jgi:hypothetical protein